MKKVVLGLLSLTTLAATALNAHAVGGRGGTFPHETVRVLKEKMVSENRVEHERKLRFIAESLHPFANLGFIGGFYGLDAHENILVREKELMGLVPGAFALTEKGHKIASGQELKATAGKISAAFRGNQFENSMLGASQELSVYGQLQVAGAHDEVLLEMPRGLMDERNPFRFGHLQKADLERLGAAPSRYVFEALSQIDIYDDLVTGLEVRTEQEITEEVRLQEVSGGFRGTRTECVRISRDLESVRAVGAGKLVHLFGGMVNLTGEQPLITREDSTEPLPLEACDAI